MKTPTPEEDLFKIGHLNGAWGVRGWVAVHSLADPPDAIFDYKPWHVGEDRRSLVPSEWRRQGRRLVVRLEGVETRDAAEALAGESIRIQREQLPPAPSGRYYWEDLTGLNVVHSDGRPMGRIDSLIETGAHDVLVVHDGETRRLIPFVLNRFIRDVDLEAGLVRVEWDPAWDEGQ